MIACLISKEERDYDPYKSEVLNRGRFGNGGNFGWRTRGRRRYWCYVGGDGMLLNHGAASRTNNYLALIVSGAETEH